MIILALHSTTPRLGVAITRDGRVLGERILPPSREHLENIALAIRDLAEETEVALGDVDGFAAAIGPGSFSGIRVGLAVVKGLALALNKPVVGVSSLEIIAWQALDRHGQAVPVIDARRGEGYAGVYTRSQDSLRTTEGPYLLDPAGFSDLLSRYSVPIVVTGDPVMDEVADTMPHVVRSVADTASPTACALLAEHRMKRGDTESPHALMPLYIRRSDAEENRARTGRP